MTEALIDLAWRLGHWAYGLVFVAATLEASAFLGLILPGETLTIVGGVLASAGIIGLPETIVAAAMGATLGDSIGYELGRRLGRPWLTRHGKRIGLHGPRLAQVEALFARHGGKTVVIARFIGFLRALAPFVAGASRMPYPRFLIFNIVGAWAWAATFVTLGYVLGQSWWIAERWVGRVGLILGALAVIAAVVLLRSGYRRRGRLGRAPSRRSR
jgi:undecaprenyl-diphosphatase